MTAWPAAAASLAEAREDGAMRPPCERADRTGGTGLADRLPVRGVDLEHGGQHLFVVGWIRLQVAFLVGAMLETLHGVARGDRRPVAEVRDVDRDIRLAQVVDRLVAGLLDQLLEVAQDVPSTGPTAIGPGSSSPRHSQPGSLQRPTRVVEILTPSRLGTT
jgi:hypothetical protein